MTDMLILPIEEKLIYESLLIYAQPMLIKC